MGVASAAYTHGTAADALLPPDLRETFRAGPEPVPGDPYFDHPAARVYFRANRWPDEPRDMGLVWTRYYAACDALSRTMMRIFATALGLAPDWFEPFIDRAVSQLVAVNYPEQVERPLPGQLRNGAHTDFGSLTLLLTENRPGGLQIMGADGAWRDVTTAPDAFVVNIGDLMAQWSNDRWRSTLHRVVNPPRDAKGETRRQSIVFFHQPNHDALIACIPSCKAPDEAPRHAPVRAGDYLRAKIRATLAPQYR
jgi:isopenicillin N synthase-like dioxygenase